MVYSVFFSSVRFLNSIFLRYKDCITVDESVEEADKSHSADPFHCMIRMQSRHQRVQSQPDVKSSDSELRRGIMKKPTCTSPQSEHKLQATSANDNIPKQTKEKPEQTTKVSSRS